MRLIDAEPMPRGKLWESLNNQEKLNVLLFLLEMPRVDAEVVRHGRWITASDPKSGRCRPRIRCSECNLIQYGTVSKHSNYCPNCGAKMDGDK